MSVDIPLVSAVYIGKSFPSVRAVDGVSFDVSRQQIFSLLGQNGAGKSTLVRMLIGMLPPDQGRFIWRSENGSEIPFDRSRIGYLPEDRGLYKDQKVTATLEYFAALRGLSRVESRRVTKEWIEKLELTQYANSKLETLSKGNQQKVQIATAVLHRPELVVLDEPFSGLDPVNQELMMELILQLKSDGAAILLSAHQLNLIERLADRVLMIASGRQVLAGTVSEICQGELGSKKLRVEFENPVEAVHLASLREDKAFRALHVEQANLIEVHFDSSQNQLDWLNRLQQLGTIKSFQSGETSLHEIYLRVASDSRQATPSTVAPTVAKI